MKDFLKSQLDELRKNKLRIGLMTIILLSALIISQINFDTAEEIQLDEPAETVPAKNISPTNEKVKAVLGASNEEFYIYNPFQNPAPPDEKVEEVPAKVEEKILPPPEPVIIQPVEKVVEVPKPPDEKFILRGTALGNEKSALVERIAEGKTEILFLKIGDKINDKIITDIDKNSIKFDDDSTMTIEME